MSTSVLNCQTSQFLFLKEPVQPDSYTSDENMKIKARSINLMKYNPNLFVNRGSDKLYYMVGGHPTAILTLGFGLLGLLYRNKLNTLRNVSVREGIWFNTLYFLLGATTGIFYSSLFFFRWQIILNDYFANYLLKRYKGSQQLNQRNIYKLKDVPNTNECYHFSTSFANSYHL